MICSMFIRVKNQHLAHLLPFYWSVLAFANQNLGIVIPIILLLLVENQKLQTKWNKYCIWDTKTDIRQIIDVTTCK